MRRVLLIPLLVTLCAFSGSAFRPANAAPWGQSTPPASAVQAVIVVERATVFPVPDRTATPLTYLYERERIPVWGRTVDGVWLLIQVDDVQGWILRAQVDLEGAADSLPVVTAGSPVTLPTLTITPFTNSASQPAATIPGAPATRTPLPTRTPGPVVQIFTPTAAVTSSDAAGTSDTPTNGDEVSTPSDTAGDTSMLPGEPPPITITLPDGWNSVDMVVPYRTFNDETAREVPLTIYFGPLPDGSQGFIYLYWGFPNTVNLASGDYNLWADGAQILRFSLVGSDCNLGLYDQRAFAVGSQEGIGAFYQAAECPEEADTAGWFAVMRMYEGSFAFFVAVEPPESLTTQQPYLQQILDTVTFVPPDTD